MLRRTPREVLEAQQQTPAEIQVWMAVDESDRVVFDVDEYLDYLYDARGVTQPGDTEPLEFLIDNPSPETVLAFEEIIQGSPDRLQLLAVRRLPGVIRSQITAGGEKRALTNDHLDRLRNVWGEAMSSTGNVGEVARAHFLADERMAVIDRTTFEWLGDLATSPQIKGDSYSHDVSIAQVRAQEAAKQKRRAA